VYNAICVIVNRYIKMALYLPIVKTITIAKLADLFLNKVVRYFGTPRGIISNYSSIFTSKF
jgi:glutamate racemase